MKTSLRVRIATWFSAIRHRRAFEQQMDEELRFHIESQTADLIAQGVAPADAERRARLAFGTSTAATQEQCRNSYGLRLWDDLIADLRYALRQFHHAPAFTLTVVAVLALGIGANAAMFTVIDATLLRRLPFGHADQLVELSGADKNGNKLGWTMDDDILGWQKATTLASIVYFSSDSGWLDSRHQLQNIMHPVVSANFCNALEVAPALGRCFAATDPDATQGQVTVLSDDLWRSFFGADPHILGQTVMLDRQAYTVVGVMPRGFAFPIDPRMPQMWSPVKVTSSRRQGDSDPRTFDALGRLRLGVTLGQAHAELSAIQYQLAAHQLAKTSLEIAQTQVLVQPYRDSLVAKMRPALMALLYAVFAMWLIACANVANLLLARGVNRQSELAIRAALGASRGRIVRQLLLESLLLSLAGAGSGLALAELALLTFGRVLHARVHMPLHPVPDLRVLGALLGLSALSTLLFGIAPALLASQVNPERSLRQQASAAPGRGSLRLQQVLVAGEIACTVVLLVACGLLLRTVFALRSVPLGFRTDHVSLVHTEVPEYKYRNADRNQALYNPLLTRIRAIHGVDSAALTTVAPLSTGFDMQLEMVFGDKDGAPESHRVNMRMHADGRDLQQVLGFRMHQGRFFNAQDTPASPPVAVVNRAFVKLWEASGKRLDEFNLILDKDKKRTIHIVGVMDDVRQISVGAPAVPEMDLCAEQLLTTDSFYQPVMAAYAEIAIRTTVPIVNITPDIRAAMAAVDPSLKGSVVETMQEVVNTNIGDQLFAAHLLETFGACALLVALTGLYGFLAYFVSQRTHDIGVRIALGAQRSTIQWMFLTRALGMIGAGLAAGLLLSLIATRLVQRFLYGVRPHDLPTLGGVAMLMLLAGLIAAWLPARRASHVEPMEALREA